MFVLLVLSFFFSACVGTQYVACPNITTPNAVRVVDCDIPPCIFPIGGAGVLEMDVLIPYDIPNLTTNLNARIDNFLIGFPVDDSQNGCNGLTNSACPLDAGELVTYGLSIPVQEGFPRISLNIILSLRDQNQVDIVCATIPAQIQ